MQQRKSQVRLMLDNTNVIYEVADPAEPKLDDRGVQKIDRETGFPMWMASLYGRGRVTGKKWNAVFDVTIVSAERPAVEEGEQVVPIDFEAMPWQTEREGKTRTGGVAFRATALQPVNDMASRPVSVAA